MNRRGKRERERERGQGQGQIYSELYYDLPEAEGQGTRVAYKTVIRS